MKPGRAGPPALSFLGRTVLGASGLPAHGSLNSEIRPHRSPSPSQSFLLKLTKRQPRHAPATAPMSGCSATSGERRLEMERKYDWTNMVSTAGPAGIGRRDAHRNPLCRPLLFHLCRPFFSRRTVIRVDEVHTAIIREIRAVPAPGEWPDN